MISGGIANQGMLHNKFMLSVSWKILVIMLRQDDAVVRAD